MSKFYQFYTAFAASFGQLIAGSVNVWPSYTIPFYKSNDTVLSEPLDVMETSLLGSLPSLGAMVGTLISGLVIDRIGRKRGGVILTMPALLSWILIEFSSRSLPILIARFMGGITSGALLVYAPIFISETADDSIRGMLASGPVTLYCFGVLLSYLLGWFCSYSMTIAVNIGTCVISAILLMCVAESPVFFVKQNRDEDACKSIAHYRGATPSSKAVLEELSRLKQQLIPASELIAVNTSEPDEKEEKEKEVKDDNEILEDKARMSPLKLLFTTPSSRRAFLVVGFIGTAQVLMGIMSVQVYAGDLFSEAAPDLSSHFCSVLLAVVMLTGSLVTAGIADFAGRRILIITSSFLVGICMATLAFLLHTKLAPAWLSAVVVLVYCFVFNCGAGTVPYVLLAEAFLPEVQGIASMIFIEWIWFLNFLLIAIFPILKVIGVHVIYYFYAIMSIVNAVVSYFIVPETKGKSIEQIQQAFLGNKRN